MKTLEWQNFFAGQREQHGMVVFSTAELANAARTTLHAVNTELGRLMKRGIIRRYAQGRYGPVQGVDVESVLTAVDPGAYATGFYALFSHSVVTQAPTETTCFTNRRHNRGIKGSALTDTVKSTLLEVFVNWLELRLKHKGKKEIEKMLLGELPDLRETQSGKDLIQIGKEEGKIEGKIEGKREDLVRVLEKKFGKLPADTRQRIGQLDSVAKLEDLLLQALDAAGVDQLNW